VSKFATWPELLGAIDDRADTRISPAVRTKLAAASDYLARAETVVRVAIDAQVHLDRPDTVPAKPADPDKLATLGERWGLGGSIDRLLTALRAT
jgi:hypothetical protein